MTSLCFILGSGVSRKAERGGGGQVHRLLGQEGVLGRR